MEIEPLLAEKQMGQVLGDIDKSDSRLRGSTRGTTVKSSLPEGINKRQSHKSRSGCD